MVVNLKNCSDVELVNLYTKGNKKAFDEIFERYFEITYSFAYSRLGNKTWAEDVTSNVFVLLIDIIKSFDDSSKLKSFIIGITLNKIRQFWYEQSKKGEVSADFDLICTEDFESSDEEDEEQDIVLLNNILTQLPDNYRLILTERFINGKNIKETAEILNISEDNVSVLQHRALKKAAEIGSDFK